MRETRLSGSEGGGALLGSPYPYRKGAQVIFSRFLRKETLRPVERFFPRKGMPWILKPSRPGASWGR
jgi:hypothetical protein